MLTQRFEERIAKYKARGFQPSPIESDRTPAWFLNRFSYNEADDS